MINSMKDNHNSNVDDSNKDREYRPYYSEIDGEI